MVDIADVTASLVHLSRVVTNLAKNNSEQAELLERTVNSVLLLQERVDELDERLWALIGDDGE